MTRLPPPGGPGQQAQVAPGDPQAPGQEPQQGLVRRALHRGGGQAHPEGPLPLPGDLRAPRPGVA